jgi:Ca-activated chloride channel family protein
MVRRADAALDVAPAFVGRGQDLQVALAPGAYVVEARDGLVTAPAVTFTIPEKGQVGVDVPLQAGLVRLPATASAVQSNAEATITVFERSSDGAAAQAVALIPESDTEGGLALLPGRYVLRFAEGNLRRDQPLDVRVGEPAIVPGPWPFGRLQIAIGGAADIASEPVAVTVYEDDPEAPRGRREVARSAAVTPDLALPAGTYTVVVRQGRVEARDRLSIAGGQVVRRTLALAGARLTVMSRVAGLPPAATNVLGDEPVSYRLERLDVVPPEVFTAHRATAEFGLPAGRYRVEARHGLVNARVSREVTLAAGETITLTLDQPAGIVRLAGPPRAGELLWELLDDAGDPLWSSAQTSPRITLRAGRYVVRLETREKRIERRFEVRAGEVRTVDVAE